ncbi:E3 ubiquitin-protein ligase TRIM56-like [Mytilus edulis]|uniref:E3 ubiquitin-protein ligase TRIM56-like n=1 Tax=Mytilus edulis TaxID=6550 RepID=UPI0039F0EF62
MSSRNTVNLITELERRYLECSICTEVFNEEERIPRLLPCHHPFCSECIKRLGRRKETIKCPTCNAVHKVKKHGPIDFPKDKTRRDLTSFLQAHSDQNAFKKCNKCGKTVDDTYKCQQCNLNLCETCRCQHQIEHETHDIIINKSETFREEQDNLDVCQNPHHEKSKLKYFCISSDCQSVLCPLCVIEEHRDISKHELEDIEKAFKKRKNELGNDTKSLRTRISHVESTKQKVLDKTNTLQDEKDDYLQNMDAIYNRGIADLKYRRQKLLDRYIIAFKRKESKLLTRKHNLDSFLQNASECCSLSEQLINHNSMSSFLSVHQTLDVHVKRYLNIAVEDSSCDTNDSETNIDFNDYLHTFNGNVELLENTRREEGLESLIEPAKGNQRRCQAANSLNVFGKYIYNNIAIVFIYFLQKVKQCVLYVISLINTILKIPFKLKQLFSPIIPYAIQPNQEHVRQRRRNVRNAQRLYQRFLAYGDTFELEQYLREHIPMAKYLMHIFALFWFFVLATCIFIFVREILLIPLTLIEHGKLTGLKFDTHVTSQFACRSADNQTVATKPTGKMSCGSTSRLYKYEGVFANTSFFHQQ